MKPLISLFISLFFLSKGNQSPFTTFKIESHYNTLESLKPITKLAKFVT